MAVFHIHVLLLLLQPVPALPPFRSPSTSDLETESSTTRSYLNSLVFTGHLINTFYHSIAAMTRKIHPAAAIRMEVEDEMTNDVIIPHHHYMVGQDCAFFQMRIIEVWACMGQRARLIFDICVCRTPSRSLHMCM